MKYSFVVGENNQTTITTIVLAIAASRSCLQMFEPWPRGNPCQQITSIIASQSVNSYLLLPSLLLSIHFSLLYLPVHPWTRGLCNISPTPFQPFYQIPPHSPRCFSPCLYPVCVCVRVRVYVCMYLCTRKLRKRASDFHTFVHYFVTTHTTIVSNIFARNCTRFLFQL